MLPHTLPTVHSVNHQNTTRAQNQGLEGFFIVSKHNKYFHFHHRSFYILLVLAHSTPAFPMPDHPKAVLRRTDAALKSLFECYGLKPVPGRQPQLAILLPHSACGLLYSLHSVVYCSLFYHTVWSTLLCSTTQCGLLYFVLPHSTLTTTIWCTVPGTRTKCGVLYPVLP